MLRQTTTASPPDTEDTLRLVIENAKGREALLERADDGLREGECLVRTVDVIGLRRSVRTVPRDPRVKLVARESPVVMRGGLTTIVTYYVAPRGGLEASEHHSAEGEDDHEYGVTLHVLRSGRGVAPAPVIA